MRKSIRFREDEGIAIEKCEEDDIDDCQVQCNEYDDGLAEREDERSVESSSKSSDKGNVSDLDLSFIPIIASQLPQVCGFPLQKSRSICLGLEEDDEGKDESGNDQSNPVAPTP